MKTCRVCGDEIGLKDDGKVFVACLVCNFPVCRPCYEYERSEGNKCCPQCNARYKRHKGTQHLRFFRYDPSTVKSLINSKTYLDEHSSQARLESLVTTKKLTMQTISTMNSPSNTTVMMSSNQNSPILR